mgnify:CR=1 FL=1
MSGILIDTNLLLLWVVGACDRGLVGRHKRLHGRYDADDFDLLAGLLGRYAAVCLTPGTLAECSNLLRQTDPHNRRRLMTQLAQLVTASPERHLAAARVVDTPAFISLGVADATLAELASAAMPLLTDDLQLYLAVLARTPDAAVNFSQLRRF